MSAGHVLPREFFGRPVLAVAPDLLGCVLAHQTREGLVAAEIVEVEAYCGEVDPASHAFRGKTARNAVMFGPPGHAYVYFTYGMHYCVNLVCQPAGEAAAVLLRAGRVVAGLDLAAARRSGAPPGAGGAALLPGGAGAPGQGHPSRAATRLASGPARLCQALGIGREQNGADVCDPHGALRVLAPPGAARARMAAARAGGTGDAGHRGGPDQARSPVIARGPRVGVRDGAEAEWRFWLEGDPAVSAYRPHVPRRRGTAGTGLPARRPDGSMHR